MPLTAKNLAGVEIAQQAKMANSDQPLQLNGAGIRTKFFVDVYIAALYLPKPESDASKIIKGKTPKRMLMHFVYSKGVGKDKLNDGWQSGFEDNSSKQEMKALQARLDKFKTLFHDMQAGDVILLDFKPSVGVEVRVNDKLMGTIDGDDFSSALLEVWLGDDPVTGSLKKDLLG